MLLLGNTHERGRARERKRSEEGRQRMEGWRWGRGRETQREGETERKEGGAGRTNTTAIVLGATQAPRSDRSLKMVLIVFLYF